MSTKVWIKNSFGPVVIDITTPTRVQILNDESRGDLGFVSLEWGNLQEFNETYQIWRHDGNPFEDTSVSSSDEPGWELVLDEINVGMSISPTIIRNVPIENGSEQMTFYAITVCDEFNNCNKEILEGEYRKLS